MPYTSAQNPLLQVARQYEFPTDELRSMVGDPDILFSFPDNAGVSLYPSHVQHAQRVSELLSASHG